MLTKLEKFESGWIGVQFSFGRNEIDVLIERLQALKSGGIGHFHFRTDDFSEAEGIADVEVALKGRGDVDNMSVE